MQNVVPQRQRIAGNNAVVVCLRGDNAVQGVCDWCACMNVLPQRQRIAGNGAVVACLRGDNAVQGVCDGGACMNVLPQRQLIAGNAAVVAKWEGVEWEQMFGPALGLFTGRFGDFTPFGWSMEWNAAVWCSRGGTAFTHLRKVCGKCGKVPHLRKVGKVRWEMERGSMVLWRRYCVYSPSEGERKMRESVSPLEGGKCSLGGGTRLYGALEAVLRLITFGR